MKRKLLLTAVATTMIFGSAITANAAQEDVFDAEYYAETYPDVVAVFGDDENVLLQHYFNYGIAEGRSASAYYNALAYKTANADLAAAFGDDWDAYADHFINYGADEGRYAGGIRAITDEEKSAVLAKMAGDVAVNSTSSSSSSSSVETDTSTPIVMDNGFVDNYNPTGLDGIPGFVDHSDIVVGDGSTVYTDPSLLQNWNIH